MDDTTTFAGVQPGKRRVLQRRWMDNDGYTSETPRGGQKTVLSLACSTMLERRLDSDCFASQAELTVREKEVLFRGKVQVVRRPPADGRPALAVKRGPAVDEAHVFLHENCFATRLTWHSTMRLLNSCMRA